MKKTKGSIEISEIPFSSYGSYFVVTELKNKLIIKDIRNGDKNQAHVFEFKFNENVVIDMTETLLKVIGKKGELHISFVNEDTLAFKGNLNLTLKYKLEKYDAICKLKEDMYEITSYSQEVKFGIKHIKGEFEIDAPWDTIGNTKIEMHAGDYYHFYICSYKAVYKESIIHHRSHGYSYEHWQALLPEDNTYAGYITWMNFVKPEGIMKRYAMYMSKNWMTNIWSWDNCFSAIFLAHIDSDLALDQYLMFSDHQDRSGMYPDYINNSFVSYSCAKPPIYGWAYEMMMKINPVYKNITLLEKVYDTISKLTKFWLEHRMSDVGLPFYVHGNESGWDNGTMFREGVPMITPDLSAFLIRQLDFLSTITKDLGMKNESERLQKQADDMFDKMISFLWRDNQFEGYLISENRFISADTLQTKLPLIIHYRLPEMIKQSLLKELKSERYLTEYGLATEAVDSPYYQSKGYWRGPIWAPVMMLFTSIMEELGEDDFLEELVSKFYHCMNQNGMTENFDAIKGTGLDDPAFAWTSSTYLHYLIKYKFLKHD